MLPDFPRLKAKTEKVLTRVMRKAAQDDPLLQMPKSEQHFEGNRFSNRDAGGHLHESAYTPIESASTVKRTDIIDRGIFAYLESMKQVAEDMKKQAAQMMLNTMEKATREIGNVVDNGGKPFTFETFLRGLEKVQIDFDENGKPQMPTILMHPDQAEGVKRDMETWELPENKKRVDEIIERKRKEWNDRESNRKLVD